MITKITLGFSFHPSFLPSSSLQTPMEDSHPHDEHQAGRLHLGEEEVGGLGLRGGVAIIWGRRRGIGAAARVEERGGRPKGWGSEREGAARVKGGGELMGSPPTDRDPRPKLALTSAPDPSAQIQQVIYYFTGGCFLKNSNPNYTDHDRKGKNKFNFFSENWVSHSTPLKKNLTSNSDASIGTTRKDQLINKTHT
jgi:hypothetical protein